MPTDSAADGRPARTARLVELCSAASSPSLSMSAATSQPNTSEAQSSTACDLGNSKQALRPCRAFAAPWPENMKTVWTGPIPCHYASLPRAPALRVRQRLLESSQRADVPGASRHELGDDLRGGLALHAQAQQPDRPSWSRCPHRPRRRGAANPRTCPRARRGRLSSILAACARRARTCSSRPRTGCPLPRPVTMVSESFAAEHASPYTASAHGALLDGEEARAHLHALGAQREGSRHAATVGDAAGGDDGDGNGIAHAGHERHGGELADVTAAIRCPRRPRRRRRRRSMRLASAVVATTGMTLMPGLLPHVRYSGGAAGARGDDIDVAARRASLASSAALAGP